MRRTASVIAGCTCALAFASGASAAAPNSIRVTGPGLARPVLLSNWQRNLDLMLAIGSSSAVRPAAVARGLRARPRLAFTLYWNWTGLEKPTAKEKALECLTSSDGCPQRGWFYPAYRGRTAVADFISNDVFVPRAASRELLSLLRASGIPVVAR